MRLLCWPGIHDTWRYEHPYIIAFFELWDGRQLSFHFDDRVSQRFQPSILWEPGMMEWGYGWGTEISWDDIQCLVDELEVIRPLVLLTHS
jgi:hypothetical protein